MRSKTGAKKKKNKKKKKKGLLELRLINLIMAGDKKKRFAKKVKFGTGTGYGLTMISC